jgi:hypothetical protein
MRRLAKIFVLAIFDDADNFNVRARRILGQTNALAERILRSEQHVRTGFIDDRDPRGAWPIVITDISPGEKPRPGCPEVAGRDVVQNRSAPFVRLGDGPVGA